MSNKLAVSMMLPALALVALLYMIPLATLATVSFGEHGFTLDAYDQLFGAWSYGTILVRSVRLSIIVTLGCLLFGYPMGYVVAFSAARTRALLALLVLLPFWTSVLVRNFAWIYLLRDGGALSTLAGARLLYQESGVVIAMVGTLLPFMVLPVWVSIAARDRSLREAAASLGASPARVFLAVTLPQSRAGIYAGCLLTLVTAMGFFITPALLGGGHVFVAATFIDHQIEEFLNWPLAAAAAMVLLMVVIAPVALYLRLAGRRWLGAQHAAY